MVEAIIGGMGSGIPGCITGCTTGAIAGSIGTTGTVGGAPTGTIGVGFIKSFEIMAERRS